MNFDSEHDIQNKIRLAIGEKQAAIIFRANVGEGWNGRIISKVGDKITLDNAHRISTGLPRGFPDLFGLKTVTITPEMVGKKIAVFVFIEVKKNGGKATENQKHLHSFLQNAGAVGGIAHSPSEALQIIDTI